MLVLEGAINLLEMGKQIENHNKLSSIWLSKLSRVLASELCKSDLGKEWATGVQIRGNYSCPNCILGIIASDL